MISDDLIQFLVLLLLLGLSAFFSSAETAMTTVNRIRIRALAEEGDRRAATMLKIAEKDSKMLSAILIGNNLVNISASSLATTLTIRLLGSAAVGIATGILTLLVLIFGEITPKTMASLHAEKISLAYAPVIWRLMQLMTPLIFLVDRLSGALIRHLPGAQGERENAMTEQELRTYVDAGHEAGVLEQQEHQVITNVFDFVRSQVREVMVPRVDMVTVWETDSYDAVREVFQREKFTRLPVCGKDRDDIVGVINMKDFLFREDREQFQVSRIMYEPYYTYEFKKTSELLLEMRQQSLSLTIVLDEYGQPVGMVTLEDLLEELVGEIRDEYDADETNLIRKIGPGEYSIEGSVKLDDINDALPLKLHSEDYDSLGGYVIERLDHLPVTGEEVVGESGETLRVVRMDKNRIKRILLRLPQTLQ